MVSAGPAEDGAYRVDLLWLEAGWDHRRLRAEVFALIGAVAEHSTHVRERRAEDAVEFEVATGILDGDSGWRAHGHLLRLRVADAAIVGEVACVVAVGRCLWRRQGNEKRQHRGQTYPHAHIKSLPIRA